MSVTKDRQAKKAARLDVPKKLARARALAPKPAPRAPQQEKRPPGRPTLYRPEYDIQAFKLCLLLNAGDEQLADYFEVAPSTIAEWKLAQPSFSESVKNGKLRADMDVAVSLRQLAMGYEYEEEEAKTVGTGIGFSKIEKIKVTRHMAANVAAQSIYLRNRQREYWKNDPHASGAGNVQPQEMARLAREAIYAATATIEPDDESQ